MLTTVMPLTIEEADFRGLLKAAKCKQILPSLFFQVEGNETEYWKGNLPRIISTEAKQCSSNALRRTGSAQLLHYLGCAQAERASQSTANTPVPTSGEHATQHKKEELLQVLVWYFTAIYMLHVRGIIQDRTGLRPTVDTFSEREDRFPKVTDRWQTLHFIF